MRIGFIGPFAKMNNANYGSELQVGAIEYQLFGLAKELRCLGHEVFITRNWKGKNSEDTIEGIRFLNVNCFSSIAQGFNDSKMPLNHLSHVRYAIKAAKVLSEKKLDVVNVSRVFSGWLALKHLHKHKSRSVFITHDNDVFVTRGLGHSRIPYLPRKALNQVNKCYDATVATTSGVKTYLKTIGLDCQAVITESVDHNKYQSGEEEGYILAAARFVPHKRLQDLIEAYSRMGGQVKEDLVIIGSGPCESSLKRYANSLKSKERIHFVQFLPKSEYRRYLSNCSVFVLPSVAEAFGVVVIEAMASGKPVLVRNIVGPKDIISHGHNGFLFDTVFELTEYLTLILANEKMRKQMGKNARKTVEEKYTFSIAAKEYLRLYEHICSE
jgi:glycosyltransferase involved in cell wall biosynthesis